MKNLKKLFLVTSAIGGALMLAGVANAAVVSAPATSYVSGTGAPAATVSFGNSASLNTIAADTSAAFTTTGLFTPGNNFTLTLPTGNTFAALPTITIANGGTLNYISGGASANAVTYQIQGATTTTSAITVTGIAVQNVSSTAAGSTINVSISDSGGALSGVSATAKQLTVATFADPYSFSFVAAGTAPQVDLSATAPGSRYTNTNSAALGTISVIPASSALVNWAGSTATISSATSTSNLVVTLPAGTNPSVSLTGSGAGCSSLTGSATSISATNTVTFSNLALPAPGGAGNCNLAIAVAGPSTGTTLLGAGATSAVLTVGLTATTNLVGTTRTSSPSLTPITYANGTVVNAGYVTGDSASYDNFISVTTGATAGPVIVSLAGGQAGTSVSGTAVLNASQAANTNVLYPLGSVTGAGIGTSIRTALQGAGVSTAALASDSDRGSIQVVVPTGSRVAPLIRNRSNGQIVEVGRQ